MALQFTLDVAQRTDIGRISDNNEDNLVAVVPEDMQLLQAKGALFVVSDGMGGHARGEVASELAVQQIRDERLGVEDRYALLGVSSRATLTQSARSEATTKGGPSAALG